MTESTQARDGPFGHWPAATRLLVLTLDLVLAAAPVWAHKLRVFAAAEGRLITGSAYFAGGAAAGGATVLVTDAQGNLLAQLQPAADGRFSYRAEAPVEHRVIAQTADGHRAEWRIAADELGGGFRDAALEQVGPSEAKTSRAPVAVAASEAATGCAPPSNGAPTPGHAALEAALSRQLRPLREELLATREALRLQDILGGIGYIFGLAGVALWWRCRHRPKPPRADSPVAAARAGASARARGRPADQAREQSSVHAPGHVPGHLSDTPRTPSPSQIADR